MFTVYILRTSGNTLYVGQTKDLAKRLANHPAKYLRAFTSYTLVYSETHLTRSAALKREYQLKQLTRSQKEQLLLKV